MARNGLIPDKVLCSSAQRARETWDLVSEHLGDTPWVEIRDDLYHASPGSLLTILQDLSPTVDTVLLVGHNPTFEDLAHGLVGQGPDDLIMEMGRKYPTGALAVMDFLVDDWNLVRRGAGHLRDFIRPKTLR